MNEKLNTKTGEQKMICEKVTCLNDCDKELANGIDVILCYKDIKEKYKVYLCEEHLKEFEKESFLRLNDRLFIIKDNNKNNVKSCSNCNHKKVCSAHIDTCKILEVETLKIDREVREEIFQKVALLCWEYNKKN